MRGLVPAGAALEWGARTMANGIVLSGMGFDAVKSVLLRGLTTNTVGSRLTIDAQHSGEV